MVEQGKQGLRGPRGRPGTASTPVLRVRMLTLYVVMVVLLAGFAYVYQRAESDRRSFERKIVANCISNRDNTVRFNAFIDRLVDTYQTSRVLTEAEKEQRTKFFAAAKGRVPECPPRTGR